MGIAQTIAKNTVFFFFTTVLDTVGTLVIGIILARTLGTEQYGLYSLLLWFLSLAVLAANLGFGEMVKRFIAEAVGQRNATVEQGLVQLTLKVRIFFTLFISVLVVVFSGYLARLFGRPDDGIYFMLVAGLLVTFMITATVSAIFAGFQKYEYSTYVSLTTNFLRIVAVIIMTVLGLGVKEIISTYIGISAVSCIVAFILLNRLVPLRGLFTKSLLEPAVRNNAIKFSLAALGILGVDYFLWSQAEVFILGIYQPVEVVGFYNIAHRIPLMAMTLVPFVFGSVLLPAISEQFGKGEMEKIKRIYTTAGKYLMILSFPIAAAGIALAGPIINIVYGSSYAPAIILMQIVFIPFAMRGLVHAVTSIIYGIKEPAFLLKMGVVLILLSLALNFLLIPKYGAIGAVIATSVPRLIALPLYIRFVSKRIGQSWPVRDGIKIVLASVGMGLIVFLIQYYLGDALGLGVGIPVGFVICIAALLALRLVKHEDMRMLRQLEKRAPAIFRGIYTAALNLVGKFAK